MYDVKRNICGNLNSRYKLLILTFIRASKLVPGSLYQIIVDNMKSTVLKQISCYLPNNFILVYFTPPA